MIKSRVPFCTGEDSKSHRLLECPIGDEIRANFKDVVTELQESNSTLADFTVLHVHTDSEYLDLAQYQHGFGIFTVAVQRMVVDFQSKAIPINWYTDGSCQYPHLITSRYSAYSVI